MKSKVIPIILIILAFTGLSCGGYYGKSSTYDKNAVFGGRPHFEDSFLLGPKGYKSRFSAPVDFNADPSNLLVLKKKFSSHYFRYFTDSTLRIRNNLFCASINPSSHRIKKLPEIIARWRAHVAAGKNNFKTEYLNFAKQEKEDYCWVAALQFIALYQFDKYQPQSEIFMTLTKDIKDSQINAGSFFTILDFHKEFDTKWWVSSGSESILITGNEGDSPVLLAIRDPKSGIGHIVLALGSVFSFITNNQAQLLNNIGQIPLLGTLMHPSHFVFHKILIFDPYDSSIKEYDTDHIFERLDFLATLVYARRDPYPSIDIRGQHSSPTQAN